MVSVNQAAIRKLLTTEAGRLPESARGSISAQAYVDSRVMPAVVTNIVATRPLLWTSLLKCRAPEPRTDFQSFALVRQAALDRLKGHELLEALERLEGNRLISCLEDFISFLRNQLPYLQELFFT